MFREGFTQSVQHRAATEGRPIFYGTGIQIIPGVNVGVALRGHPIVSPAGHFEFGTSLWFEDIVGHRAIADQTVVE